MRSQGADRAMIHFVGDVSRRCTVRTRVSYDQAMCALPVIVLYIVLRIIPVFTALSSLVVSAALYIASVQAIMANTKNMFIVFKRYLSCMLFTCIPAIVVQYIGAR